MPHDQCPPSKRGHTWREARTRRANVDADLRVCQRCGALGRVNSQGVVLLVTAQEAKIP